jgi:hypothetical protein
MPEAVMTLQYEGPAVESGAMDVRQLAPALLATADLMREGHALLDVPGPVPEVHVQATRPGSFYVDLLVADPKIGQQIVDLLTSRTTTAGATLGTLVGSVVGSFQLVAWLRNRKIAKTEPVVPGRVRVTMADGTTLEIPPETLRLALDAEYRRQLQAVVRPLAAQTGVTTLTVRTEDASATVTEPDAPAFEVPPVVQEDLGAFDTEVVLRPVNVAFSEGNKWRFSDGENTFHAAIEDPAFMQSVDLGTERFAKNDMLRVLLRTHQMRGADGNLHTERTVVRVLQHISGQVQLDLFADSGPEASTGDGLTT